MVDVQNEEIQGIVSHILFRDERVGFAVCRVEIAQGKQIVVKGMMPTISVGQTVLLNGSWENHPKFGAQFSVTQYRTTVPHSKEGLLLYLSSGAVKGIGPVLAGKLIHNFGEKIIEVIEQQPQRLLHVDGIGAGRQEKIVQSWHEHKFVSHIMIFLQEHGVSPAYALKIFKRYGEGAIKVIQENPYQLAEEVWGIGFTLADKIALKNGVAPDSLPRIIAAIQHALSTEIALGHVYVHDQKLLKLTASVLTITEDSLKQIFQIAVQQLLSRDRIRQRSKEEKLFFTLTSYYVAEQELAQLLQERYTQQLPYTFADEQLAQLLNQSVSITLADEQIQGIKKALQNKVSIVTGGPGTGKTTLVRGLLGVLEKLSIQYVLTAPTGRAAKRLSESTGQHGVTIHRLLEFDPITRRFQRNQKSPIKATFIVVDEASMIDLFLAHALVRALSENASILLIGDIDQLPSVGAGNVLKDMIESEQIACTRLKTIFRQAENSTIVINAHRINQGEFPLVRYDKTPPDFLFIREDDSSVLQERLRTIFKKTIPESGIAVEDSIVLTPMHRGNAGSIAINSFLQSLLNTDSSHQALRVNGVEYKVGDRVMQLRNNYDKQVFNGDIGVVDSVNTADNELSVKFLEKIVLYEGIELQELSLAYAISIHKSQGSEYAAVVVPVFMQHFMLLQRNLLYTAITRAKKLCIFIGEPRAIGMALGNKKGSERVTFLRELLTSEI